MAKDWHHHRCHGNDRFVFELFGLTSSKQLVFKQMIVLIFNVKLSDAFLYYNQIEAHYFQIDLNLVF